MNRFLMTGLLVALGLAGCGAETAGTAATVASMKAKEAQQAQQSKEQVLNKLDEANRAAEQRLKDAESK